MTTPNAGTAVGLAYSARARPELLAPTGTWSTRVGPKSTGDPSSPPARRRPGSAAGRRPPARRGSRQFLPLPPPPRPTGRNPAPPDRRPPPCSPTRRTGHEPPAASRSRAGRKPAARPPSRAVDRRRGVAGHRPPDGRLRHVPRAAGVCVRRRDRSRGTGAASYAEARAVARHVDGVRRRHRARVGRRTNRWIPESAPVPRVPVRPRGHTARVVSRRARGRRLVRAPPAARARRIRSRAHPHRIASERSFRVGQRSGVPCLRSLRRRVLVGQRAGVTAQPRGTRMAGRVDHRARALSPHRRRDGDARAARVRPTRLHAPRSSSRSEGTAGGECSTTASSSRSWRPTPTALHAHRNGCRARRPYWCGRSTTRCSTRCSPTLGTSSLRPSSSTTSGSGSWWLSGVATTTRRSPPSPCGR